MKIEKNPKASTKAAAELTEIIPALKPNHAAGILNYLVPSVRIITTCRDESNACVVLYSEDVLNELRSIASEVHENHKDLSPLSQANKFMLKVADGRFNFRTDTVTATFAIVGSIEKNFEGLYQSYEIKSIIAKLIEAMPDDQGYVAVFYANQVYLNDLAKKHIYEEFKQLAATKQEQLNRLKEAKTDGIPSYSGQTDMFEDGLSKEDLKALEDFYVKIMQCCHSGWIRYIARNIVRHIPEQYKSNAAVLVKTYCELLQDAKKLKIDNGCGIETAIKQVMMSKFGVEYSITAKYESSSKKIAVIIRRNKIELSKAEAKSIVEQLFNTNDNAIHIRGVRIMLSQIEKKQLVGDIMSSM